MNGDDLLAQMADLFKQATTERSHYYTASVLRDAMAEIVRLRGALDNERLLTMYRRVREAAVVQHEAYGAYPGLVAALKECPNV